MSEPLPEPSQEAPRSVRARVRARSWALTVLAVLAVLYTLYYGRAFLLPVVMALLLALLLSPVVSALKRLRIPSVLASALVVLGLLAAVTGTVSALSVPAWEWVQQAPDIARKLSGKIAPLKRTVEEVQAAAAEVEQITQGAEAPTLVRLEGRSPRDLAWSWLQSAAAGMVMTVFLLYFLLASGDRFARNAMSAMPRWRDKRRLLEITLHLQQEVSAYLLTIAAINLGLGLATALAMYLVGMPSPLLWGVMAGLLNFIPYLGPAVTTSVIAVVASLSFDSLERIVLAPGLFLLLTSLEGQLLTPTILGQRLSLSPIMIFLGLLFWTWMWGAVGALLAVPILVTFKIVCDHIEPLRPVGIMMGR